MEGRSHVASPADLLIHTGAEHVSMGQHRCFVWFYVSPLFKSHWWVLSCTLLFYYSAKGWTFWSHWRHIACTETCFRLSSPSLLPHNLPDLYIEFVFICVVPSVYTFLMGLNCVAKVFISFSFRSGSTSNKCSKIFTPRILTPHPKQLELSTTSFSPDIKWQKWLFTANTRQPWTH